MTRRKTREETRADSAHTASGQARVDDSDTMLPSAGHATTPAPPQFPTGNGSDVDGNSARAPLAEDAFDPPTLSERRSSDLAPDASAFRPRSSDAGDVHSSFRPRSGDAGDVPSEHLRGLLEALVFASDKPLKTTDLARAASAPVKQTRDLLAELKVEYASRGIVLEEVAGGWLFRTSALYAPFVRDLTNERPVRLSRAQVETLAIVAYRQPITRPEIDDIRGVDSGATLKLLLERDLVRILGKKDEPGRPLLYGSTAAFLELFGLKSLKDLPTLKEFTELNEDSRRFAQATLEGTSPAPPERGRNHDHASVHDTTLLPTPDDSEDSGF